MKHSLGLPLSDTGWASPFCGNLITSENREGSRQQTPLLLWLEEGPSKEVKASSGQGPPPVQSCWVLGFLGTAACWHLLHLLRVLGFLGTAACWHLLHLPPFCSSLLCVWGRLSPSSRVNIASVEMSEGAPQSCDSQLRERLVQVRLEPGVHPHVSQSLTTHRVREWSYRWLPGAIPMGPGGWVALRDWSQAHTLQRVIHQQKKGSRKDI